MNAAGPQKVEGRMKNKNACASCNAAYVVDLGGRGAAKLPPEALSWRDTAEDGGAQDEWRVPNASASGCVVWRQCFVFQLMREAFSFRAHVSSRHNNNGTVECMSPLRMSPLRIFPENAAQKWRALGAGQARRLLL